MRQLLLSITLIIAFIPVYGQPEISLDWAPDPGEEWKQRVMLDNPALGDAGADVTWDFSDAIVGGALGQITFEFVEPDDTPYVDSFPDATVCAFLSFGGFGDGYGYYRKDATGFEYLGQGNNFGFTIYLDPQRFEAIGLNFGETVEDEYTEVLITNFGQPDTSDGVSTFNYDAFGTLVLGDVMIENVARIHQTDAAFDSTESFQLTTVYIDSTDTYAWIAEGSVFPVVQWQRTYSISRTYVNGVLALENISGPDTSFSFNPDYGIGTSVASVREAPSPAIRPNPARHLITVDGEIAPGLEYFIADLYGRVQLAGKSGGGPLTLDVSKLPAGTYIFNLEGHRPSKFVKIE